MGDQSTFSTSENHEPEKILKKTELLGNDPVYGLIHEIPVFSSSQSHSVSVWTWKEIKTGDRLCSWSNFRCHSSLAEKRGACELEKKIKVS